MNTCEAMCLESRDVAGEHHLTDRQTSIFLGYSDSL